MGGDKAIGCHSHPQGNQELKISYKLFNPPRRQDKAIGCQSHDHQVPKVQLWIPLFYFEENLFTPGEETLRETPKLCCLLETQPDHDGVKDHDGGVEDHDDHGDEGVDVTKMISMLLNSLDICARCGR